MPPTQLSAIQPSPKRKRDPPPHVPLVNTTLRTAGTPPSGSPAPESPRNAVADQLRGMTIAALPAIPMSPLTPTDDLVRKKPKLELMREDSGTSTEDFTDAEFVAWEQESVKDTIAVKSPEAREIPETPQSKSESQSQRQTHQPRISPDIAAFAQPVAFTSSSTEPPKQVPTSSKQLPRSKSRPSQPRPRNMSPSPPLTSLTWQDNEITGHLVDPSTDPEDDGTGINGIGFRPTPALANARAQKRRQQLMEWKAREAKEARAKRSERRRRGVGGASTSSREGTVERETIAKEADAARRAVRFAI